MEELTCEGWKLNVDAVRELAGGITQQDLRRGLLDTDLKEVGAPCLPVTDRNTGRLVLQLASLDNIGESRKSDRGKRMLRLKLTDGHSVVTAIEYRHVPFLSQDVVPGTKVLVKGARVQNGILLLDDRSIQVLGGRVSVLYEAWEIQRKYFGSCRATSQSPPVFGVAQTSTEESNTAVSTAPSAPSSSGPKVARIALESNPEAGPAQNQGAAKKLLDRKSDNVPQTRRRRQGRGGYENESVITLDEWEAQKSGSRMHESDEEFARKLQEQLDLESEAAAQGEAEQIRLSMFSFSREEPRTGGRGRGRGRRRW